MEHNFTTLKAKYLAFCKETYDGNERQEYLVGIGVLDKDEAEYEEAPALSEFFIDWAKTQYKMDLAAFKKTKGHIGQLAECGLVSYEVGLSILRQAEPSFLGYMYNFIISKWQSPSEFVQDISTRIRLPQSVLEDVDAIDELLRELIANADEFDDIGNWELSTMVALGNYKAKLRKAA